MLEGTEWKSRQSGSEGSTMTREHEVGVRHPSVEGEDIDNGITCLIDLANSVNHSLHTHTKTEPPGSMVPSMPLPEAESGFEDCCHRAGV